MTVDFESLNRAASGETLRKHVLLYPDERVVAYLARTWPDRARNAGRTALDVGFGSGRHMKLLLDYGFSPSGIDYSEVAVETVEQTFGDALPKGAVSCCSLANQPFDSATFDVIVCWGALFLAPKDEMKRDLASLGSLLKSGGGLIVNFRTRDNWFFGLGASLSGDTYALDERAGEYANYVYTFLDVVDCRELLENSGFAIEYVECYELWKDDPNQRHSWYAFAARRAD